MLACFGCIMVVCLCAVDCSEPSVRSVPVTERQTCTADRTLQQTKPDDPKFVGRLKTLNLGVSRKRRSSRGLVYSLVSFLFVRLFSHP